MDKQQFHALSIPENRREKIVIDLKNHNLEPTTSLVGSIYMVQRLSGIDYTLNDINGMIEKNKRNLLPSVANPFITGIIQECQVIRTLQENNASYGFERFSEKSIEAFKTLHQEAGIDYDLSKVGELWKEQQQNAFRYKASTKSFSEISIEEAVRTISRECFWPSVTDVSITKYGYRPTEELKDAIATMRWETGFQYGIPGMNKLLEKQEERLANVPFQNSRNGSEIENALKRYGAEIVRQDKEMIREDILKSEFFPIANLEKDLYTLAQSTGERYTLEEVSNLYNAISDNLMKLPETMKPVIQRIGDECVRQDNILEALKEHNLHPTEELVASIEKVWEISGKDYSVEEILGNKRSLLDLDVSIENSKAMKYAINDIESSIKEQRIVQRESVILDEIPAKEMTEREDPYNPREAKELETEMEEWEVISRE